MNYNEVNGRKVNALNISYCRDRFGNKNNAVYFYGNSDSYINLGNYEALKPKTGSIAMWVYMEIEIWSGKGRYMNPFILTKNAKGNDFYEAYCIVYFNEIKKVSALCSLDSTRQLCISTLENFELNTWYHLAITYDDNYFSFYLNGRLEKKLPKNFETRFLASDSVVIGATANKKNDRFFNGRMDDIMFYDRVLSPDEVYDLYKAPDPDRNSILLKWSLVILGLLCFACLLFWFIKFRIRIGLRKEKRRLTLSNKMLENELRVQRALMNPHFIFNSLNGIQNFILTNTPQAANDYLVKFSKLIRKILESNMSDTITLELEIELLERYLEIEEMRFEENILHSIQVDPAVVPSATLIPIMMLQPFVENAIWHGLLEKEGAKHILITFELYGERYIRCVIEDNGVGRQSSRESSAGRKSLATLFIQQRLSLLNKIHQLNCELTIEDKPSGTGTIVTLLLPLMNG